MGYQSASAGTTGASPKTPRWVRVLRDRAQPGRLGRSPPPAGGPAGVVPAGVVPGGGMDTASSPGDGVPGVPAGEVARSGEVPGGAGWTGAPAAGSGAPAGGTAGGGGGGGGRAGGAGRAAA